MRSRKRTEKMFRWKLRVLDGQLATKYPGWAGSYIIRSRTGRVKFEVMYVTLRLAEFVTGSPQLVTGLQPFPGPEGQGFYLDLISEERAKSAGGTYDPKKTLSEYERRVLVDRIIPLTTA